MKPLTVQLTAAEARAITRRTGITDPGHAVKSLIETTCRVQSTREKALASYQPTDAVARTVRAIFDEADRHESPKPKAIRSTRSTDSSRARIG